MIVTAIGVAVLAAWYAHFVPLIQVKPNLVAMHRMTALSAALSGIALLLLAHRRGRVAAVFAALVFAIQLVVCAEYSLTHDFGFDLLLGPDYIDTVTSYPGRMSPVTALCYLGASAAMLALCNRKMSRLASAFAGVTGSGVAAVGIVSLCANLLWRHDTYTPGNLTSISVQSGVVFGLLGLGLMAIAWEERPGRISEWLPVGVGIAVAATVLGIWRALIEHEESDLALISMVLLGGGLLVAILVAISVYQAQKAAWRSRKLEQGKTAFERLFDASGDALLVVGRDGRILRANQRIQPLFGYTPEEVMGKQTEMLLPARLRASHPPRRADFFAHPQPLSVGASLDAHGRRKDGSEFPVDISLSPLQSERELQVLASVRDITERKQAEEALRQSEERFRSLFENSPLGLALVDKEYRYISINESYCRMLGYSAAELLSMSPLEVAHPDEREEVRRLGLALRTGGIPSYKIEKRYIKKNGETIWTTFRATAIRDRQGRVLYGLGILEDITERKGAQEALRESEERFRKVFETSPLGMGLITPDYRLAMVNASLCEMSGYSKEELLTMNPLDYTHPDDREASAAMSQRLFKGEIPYYQIEKRYIRKNGEIFWVTLTASMIRDREGRAAYVLGMAEDITQRKQVETDLRLAGEVLANMQEGVCLIRTEDHIIVQANQKFETMYGYGPGELVGQHVSVLNAPGRPSQQIENEIRAAVLGPGSWRGELLQRRKDGQTFWSSVTASRLRHHEYGLVGISIHQDITERKQAEEALRQQEERFRGLFEQSPIGVGLIAKDCRLLKVNAALCRMLGYAEAELTSRSALDFTYSDDREPTRVLVNKLFGEGLPYQKLDKRYISKSGRIIWTRVNASVIHDSLGKPMYGMVMIEDISDRKRAEEELSVLSQRLSLAVRSAALGVWDWDLRTDNAIWNERMFQIFSVARKPRVSREDWDSRIHPEDRQRVDLFLRSLIRNPVPQTVEFRLSLPDGSVRYVSAVGGATLDEASTTGVVGVVGVALDITESKRAEQKLAEQAALLDLAHDAIFVTDLDGTIRFWSRGARDTYGWSAEEALGRNSHALLETEFPADFEGIQANLRAKGGWEGELAHTTRDGRKLIMACRWSLERNETGAPHAILEINRDITARKELEEQIETSREQSAAAARLSALGMMAGGVAHEINNPLAIIHALASDLIEEVESHGKVPPDTVARSSRRILETTERIAHIVKSLRKISREGSKDRYYPVRVGKILTETLEVTRARFEARGVKLILPKSIPDLTVSCREVQIEQVVLNLLQNAFDAVVDLTGERWVRVDVASKEGAAVVSVIDSGPGIPYDLRDYVGQPFFTTKEVGKGAGLGLSLSRTIAEEHGGSVEYDDESGHTRFSLLLPLVRQAEAA